MKLYAELEEGQLILSTDVTCDRNGNWRKVEHWIGDSFKPIMRPIFRPIPSPTWRKISDGLVTYPCWVTDGEKVGEGYANVVVPGRTHAIYWSVEEENEITHWMPREAKPQPPNPPAPEKPAELIAFEKWQDRRDVDGPLLRQAWLAALEFAKGAK